MYQQENNSTKSKIQQVNQRLTGRTRKVKYYNICVACRTPKTKRLITIRRASGDLHLCRKHARAYLGEI